MTTHFQGFWERKRGRKKLHVVVTQPWEIQAAQRLDRQAVSPKFLNVVCPPTIWLELQATQPKDHSPPTLAISCHCSDILSLPLTLPWRQSQETPPPWEKDCGQNDVPSASSFFPRGKGTALLGWQNVSSKWATGDAKRMELAVRDLGSKSWQYNSGQIKWVFCGSADFSCMQKGRITHVFKSKTALKASEILWKERCSALFRNWRTRNNQPRQDPVHRLSAGFWGCLLFSLNVYPPTPFCTSLCYLIMSALSLTGVEEEVHMGVPL